MLLRDYESLLAIESSACDNGSAGPYNITVENCTLGWCGGNAIGSDYGYVHQFQHHQQRDRVLRQLRTWRRGWPGRLW